MMMADILVSLQELLAELGVSTETLIFVAIVTVMLSASMLSGQTARIGVWIEDLMYRSGRLGN